MLHDIGMSIDYDDHHKHSRYLILNGGLPGFTPVETAIIAQSARYHRKGMPSPGPMAPLFGPGDAERLDRCATLLRLAEDLERSRDQLVRLALLEESDGTVELRLVADGELGGAELGRRAARESCSSAPSGASCGSRPEASAAAGRGRAVAGRRFVARQRAGVARRSRTASRRRCSCEGLCHWLGFSCAADVQHGDGGPVAAAL